MKLIGVMFQGWCTLNIVLDFGCAMLAFCYVSLAHGMSHQ